MGLIMALEDCRVSVYPRIERERERERAKEQKREGERDREGERERGGEAGGVHVRLEMIWKWVGKERTLTCNEKSTKMLKEHDGYNRYAHVVRISYACTHTQTHTHTH